MGGGEEQRAVEPVGDDVLGAAAPAPRREWSPVVERHLSSRGGAGHRAQREDAGDDRAPTTTAVTRSNGDRGGGGQRQDQRRRRGWSAAAPAATRDLDHPHGRGEQHAGQRGERDPARPAAPAANTIAASTTACTSAASREAAPARTLTAVRAIAPVAGTPPNSGATRLARPWPNSSRSGSWRCVDAHPVGDASPTAGSPAPPARRRRAPTGSSARSREVEEAQRRRGQRRREVPDAGHGRVGATCGHDGRGDHGRAARTAAPGRSRAPTQHHDRDAERQPSAASCGSRDEVRRPRRRATRQTFSPCGVVTPSAAGTCCRAMTTRDARR